MCLKDFLKGNRWDKRSLLTALLELEDSPISDSKYIEFKSYTYTGKVLLRNVFVRDGRGYGIVVTNASGYTEFDHEEVALKTLLSLCFKDDKGRN